MNLRQSKVMLAAVGILGAAVIGGGVSIAAASGPSPTNGATADSNQSDGEQADGPDGGPGSGEEEAAITGSVPAPAEKDGEEVPDSQEQAALQKLATVSQQQAEQAALAAVPGTVAGTDLGNEDGFVVYSVAVDKADGTATDVVVDAGNATVLAQQAHEAADPQD